MAEHKSSVFRFSDVEVRESELHLRRNGDVFTVEPKAFRVLVFLLRNPGRLIPKNELLDAGWGDTAVTENSLTRNIALLRRLLNDDPRAPRYIETVSTVGYRFIWPVEVIESSDGKPEAETGSGAEVPVTPVIVPVEPLRASAQGSRKLWLILGAIAIVATIALVIAYLRRPLPGPRVTNYGQITLDGKLKFPVGTDGNRVYMNVWSPHPAIAQVPISGGQASQIDVNLPNREGSPHLVGVSPDGSSLLVLNNEDANGDGDLSVVGSQGYPARYLAKSFDAAWSPDGKFVVYSTFRGELFVIPSEGGETHLLANLPRRVTTRSGRAGDQLQWSPDGRTIRFDRDYAIWEVSSKGTNLHQILTGWRPSSFRCCGHWTADGEFYIFVSGTRLLENGPTFTPGAQLWAIDERHEGWRSRISQPIQLTSGPTLWDEPVSTRDPKRIIARGVNIRGELVRYDSDSKQLQPFLGGISADFVSFSHGGKSVAYVSSPDGILWRANLDGSGQVQLTSPPFYPKLPRWSPDGTQILFMDNSPEAMYVVPVQGGTPQRILPDDNGSQFDPNWSPDGKSVVFASFPGTSSGRTRASELRILDLASHKVTTVSGSQGMWSVRWSPDGRYLAALTSPIGVAVLTSPIGLAVFDVESQRWRELDKGIAGYPTFSRDSRSIYYLQLTQRRLLRIPVSGGQPEQVIDLKDFRLGGWWGFWMGLDPTDAPLLLRDEGTNEIYTLTLDRP